MAESTKWFGEDAFLQFEAECDRKAFRPVLRSATYWNLMEGALDFRLGQDDERPDANWQARDAARRARQHGDYACGHRQTIVFKLLHLDCAHQNYSTEKEDKNTREDANRAAHQIGKRLIRCLVHSQN